ncbi:MULTISPECIES: MBL fold metallo-hydrolase [Streptomyces]|uniref:MBL fold metallo-hydrolase n=1 Tax=Streptomyces ramulosus TaxID=47762 RepID=A0ABW1FBQ5_9ACTN
MTAPVAPAPHLVALDEDVHAYVQPDGGWCVNNAGILGGPDGAALIDTAATEARARRLHETVHTLVPGPVHTLVNTHSHGDHTFGNALFADEATVIAHERAAAEIAEHGLALQGLWPDVVWGRIEVTPPQVTFRERLVPETRGPRYELLHLGPGHTAGDAVVWLPERRVLFAGDLVFSGVTPFVLMGSVAGALEVLDRLRALEPLHVVPGHGPVGGPELLDANAGYLRRVQELARAGLAEGATPLEVARASGPGPYAGLLDGERLLPNLVRAYAELSGAGRAAPLDVPAAFGEMVRYAGGLPHCAA